MKQYTMSLKNSAWNPKTDYNTIKLFWEYKTCLFDIRAICSCIFYADVLIKRTTTTVKLI